MEFERILIKKNEGAINGAINELESTKQYFQNYVNKVIALGITVAENDLKPLFDNPKCFMTDKLTAGENMQVGGLTLNKEKLFDLIEKPTGTDSLINDILKDGTDKNKREFHIWKVSLFSINQNKVVVNPDQLELINKQHSIFIENENQKTGFEKVQQIVLLINEINQLEGKKINFHTELDEIMEVSDRAFEAKAQAVKLFT